MKLTRVALLLVVLLTVGCSTVRYVNDPSVQYQHQVQLKASKVEKLAGREAGGLPVTSIRGAAWYTPDGEYYIIGLDFDAIQHSSYIQDHGSSGLVTEDGKLNYLMEPQIGCTVYGHPTSCRGVGTDIASSHPED